ncbi:MAG TPA: ROK family transcriptional regulator [Dongiaceae bacterium]|nr:ROK family transcriptional regulator [Dongiaceae bacterium]
MRQTGAIAGTNLEQARSHNRRVVIEAVRLNGTLSRAEIARLTALSSQTISNIVTELEASGILKAAAPRRAGRGQPPTPLSIDPDGAYSIGLQLDHKTLTGVLADLSGKVRARAAVPVDEPGPDKALPAMRRMVERLRKARGIDPDPRCLLGVGVAMPGPFGVEGITSVGPTALPGWQDYPLAEALGRATGLPVIVENDATAAAIGERLHGVARRLANFAYFFIGTGLGAGLILGGQLYRGSASNAGEIGHMVIAPRGRACVCGNRGCLERYVSLRAAYEWLRLPDPDHASPEILTRLLESGDRRLERWIGSILAPMRQAINILECLLDPDAIVLGGFMPQPVLEALVERLDPLPSSVGARRGRSSPRILLGSAGRESSVLGAAALPIFGEINPQFDVLLKPHRAA